MFSKNVFSLCRTLDRDEALLNVKRALGQNVFSLHVFSICSTLDRDEAFLALTELWGESPLTRDDFETLFSFLDADISGVHTHTHTHTPTHTHTRTYTDLDSANFTSVAKQASVTQT